MKLLEFQPKNTLNKHILQYLFIEETTEVEKPYVLPPNGIPGLVIQYKETLSTLKIGKADPMPSCKAFVVGIYKDELIRTHLGEVGVMCIFFQPTSLYHLFGKHCQQFSENVTTNLTDIVGDNYDAMITRVNVEEDYESKIEIFETFVENVFSKTKTKFTVIDDIAKDIFYSNGIIKLVDILEKYKISRRWMEKGFAERVGVSPKYYIDLIRFNHVIRLLRNSTKKDWNKIVLECGFHDHPHLIRQFKKFSRSSPKLLFEQENELFQFLLGNY